MSWMLLEKCNAGRFCGQNIWTPPSELSIRLDIVTIMKPSVESLWVWRYQVKGAVSDSSPMRFFSNSANISSQCTTCVFCVCALKKLVFIHWLSSGETNQATQHYSSQSATRSIYAHGFIKRKGVVTHEQMQACWDKMHAGAWRDWYSELAG